MLKKVLCLVIIVVSILATAAVGTTAATDNTQAPTKSYLMGDADLDGQISVMDATAIQRALAGIIELTEEQLITARVNGFENLYIGDATEVQRYIAGYKCSTSIGEEIKIDNEPTTDKNFVYPKEEVEDAIAKRFMEYVNEERKAVGVDPLDTNEILMNSSKIRGEEIVIEFSHTRPDGSLCFTAVETPNIFWSMGENIAEHSGWVDFSDPDTIDENIDAAAKRFFTQFKESPGHYANMINENFNCHGVGITIIYSEQYGGFYKCHAAHMFGQTW